MFINSEKLAYDLTVTAQNNGDAYRDSKNVKRAITEAKAEALKEFREYLDEAATKAETEVHAHWFEDEIKEQQSQEWNEKLEKLKKGEQVEISKTEYHDLLEALPPVDFGQHWFIMGEPYSHTNTGNPIHLKCWFRAGKYYGQYTELNN